MARDLAIAGEVASGTAPPTLRFYRWDPPAVSLGRFQDAAAVVDREACRRLGVDLVRRPTGGRAVLHCRELTYSIAVPESHPLIPRDILEAYRLLSRGILDAFRRLGIPAGLAPGTERGGGPVPGSCFDTASAYEVRVAGKKVVGSAQLRQDGVLLQHGAILLELPLKLYRQVLKPQDGEKTNAYLEVLGREAAGLHDLGYRVAAPELARALAGGFAKIFDVYFTRVHPDAQRSITHMFNS